MKIGVMADDDQLQELTKDITGIIWERITSLDDTTAADAYIILSETNIADFKNIKQPILFNAVTNTLKELNAPPNVLRINGWKSFLSRKCWEIAGNMNEETASVFSAMGKQIVLVKDKPGLIAARPIAMIINEAYFALEEGVSTKTEIDTAMKLGTNYPFGPFEWAALIGLSHIYSLLHLLSLSDTRYIPSLLLKQEAAV